MNYAIMSSAWLANVKNDIHDPSAMNNLKTFKYYSILEASSQLRDALTQLGDASTQLRDELKMQL